MIAIEPIIFVKGCNSKHKNIYLVYSSELLNCHKVTMAFAWFGGRAFKFLLHVLKDIVQKLILHKD